MFQPDPSAENAAVAKAFSKVLNLTRGHILPTYREIVGNAKRACRECEMDAGLAIRLEDLADDSTQVSFATGSLFGSLPIADEDSIV
jgi:hypothetical protein